MSSQKRSKSTVGLYVVPDLRCDISKIGSQVYTIQ